LSSDFHGPDEKNFHAYLTKIKDLNPEGVCIVDVSSPAATQVKEIAELGIACRQGCRRHPASDSL
jgi:hypothetical protein